MKTMGKYNYLKSIVVSIGCTIVAAIIMIVFQTIYNNNVENSLVDKSLTEIPVQLDSESHAREALGKNGILFIDEFCEMPQKTIEVLRGRNDGGHRGTSSGGKTAAKGTLCR